MEITLEGFKKQMAMMTKGMDKNNKIVANRSMKNIQIPQIVKMMTFRINYFLDNVYINTSTQGEGRGVFAKKNIKQGNIITFYPADAIKITPSNVDKLKETGKLNAKSYGYVDGQQLPSDLSIVNSDNLELFNNYYYKINNTFGIIGHPVMANDMSFVGHIINDGAKCSKIEHIELYTNISKSKQNCEYVLVEKCTVAMVATRDISENEEIFAHYGSEFWLANY